MREEEAREKAAELLARWMELDGPDREWVLTEASTGPGATQVMRALLDALMLMVIDSVVTAEEDVTPDAVNARLRPLWVGVSLLAV